MISSDIKSKIDAVWNAFWTGGIANPLEVIKQIAFLQHRAFRGEL